LDCKFHLLTSASPTVSLLRHSSQTLLQQAHAQAQIEVEDTTSEHVVQLKHRHEEADILEREEGVKRFKIENEERMLKLEMERIELEERKLALLERKRAAGLSR
jgi:hypothetical protein